MSDHTDNLGEAVNKINKIVLNYGGWDIIGWYQCGQLTDQTSECKISSEHLNLHVAYLLPSSPVKANSVTASKLPFLQHAAGKHVPV